jgi:hypothetical protein
VQVEGSISEEETKRLFDCLNSEELKSVIGDYKEEVDAEGGKIPMSFPPQDRELFTAEEANTLLHFLTDGEHMFTYIFYDEFWFVCKMCDAGNKVEY